MCDASSNPDSLPPAAAADEDPRGPWAVPRDAAIPKLVEEHGGRLYGLSSRICSDSQEAEDLVQEVFLQAWRKWDQFRGDSSPHVWLFTIARHTCQRMHRKRSGEPDRLESIDTLMSFGEPEVGVVPREADPLGEQIRAETKAQVENAIAALPVDFRMPLILKEIVGFTLVEVAQILDVPAATVKTRVHRARLKVRKIMESGLPKRAFPPPPYSRQVCLDLLDAKQEALDHGVPIESFDRAICGRCDALFATLDLAAEHTRELRRIQALPAALKDSLLDRCRSEAG